MRKKNEEPKVKENAAVVSFLCHSTSLSILSHPSSHVRRRRRGYARTSRETGWGLRDEWRPRSESRDTRPSVSGSLGSVVTPFLSPSVHVVATLLLLRPKASGERSETDGTRRMEREPSARPFGASLVSHVPTVVRLSLRACGTPEGTEEE